MNDDVMLKMTSVKVQPPAAAYNDVMRRRRSHRPQGVASSGKSHSWRGLPFSVVSRDSRHVTSWRRGGICLKQAVDCHGDTTQGEAEGRGSGAALGGRYIFRGCRTCGVSLAGGGTVLFCCWRAPVHNWKNITKIKKSEVKELWLMINPTLFKKIFDANRFLRPGNIVVLKDVNIDNYDWRILARERCRLVNTGRPQPLMV